ncbi:MAG: hypothetical protein E7A63_05155 [Clostridium butyricum]|jgi:hypothetical protein|nr:hypothetical protein [Clostridium butyricum]
MDSILKQLYLMLGAGAVVFTVTGGAIGYIIGFRNGSKIYKRFNRNYEDDFIRDIKNDINK